MNSRRSKSYSRSSVVSTSSFASNRAVRNYHPAAVTSARNSNHLMSTTPLLSSEMGSRLSKPYTTSATGSSFASNRAVRNYSPAVVTSRNSNRFASNHFVSTAPQSMGSRTSHSSAVSGLSFASNRAVRNYSPAVTTLTRNSSRSFTSNHFVQKPPQSSSEMVSTSTRLTSAHSSADSVSVSSFASNRAVHNYAPARTSARNSNRLTPDSFRRYMRAPLTGSSRNLTSHTSASSGSNFVSNLAAVYNYVPPVSSWHSTSSYNSVASESSFVSNGAVRGYASH